MNIPQRGVSTGGYNFKWKPNSVGSIVNQIKSVCTKRINHQFPNLKFAWQAGYHDIIIKNNDSLDNIIYYIRNNPLMWQRDRNNLK